MTKMIKKKKTLKHATFLGFDEFNMLLKKCYSTRTVKEERFLEDKYIGPEVYVFDTGKIVYIAGRMLLNNTYFHVYAHRLDDLMQPKQITPMEAAKRLHKSCKIHDIVSEDPDIVKLSSSPIRIEAKEGIYPEVWTYDVNKAYIFGMMHADIPDTRENLGMGVVKAGMIGYVPTGETIRHIGPDGVSTRQEIKIADEGQYALYRFPSRGPVLKRFADRIAGQMIKATNDQVIADLKQIAAIAVGCLQNKNPFARCAVVDYVSKHVQRFVSPDVIKLNTDSITSVRPIKDIPISDQIGDFKLVENECGKMIRTKQGYIFNDSTRVMYGGDRDINTKRMDYKKGQVVRL